MRTLTSFRMLRVTLAFAVSLWMAGAGCLLGCENNVANAATEVGSDNPTSALVVSGDACASAHSSSCCSSHGAGKRSARTKQSVRTESPSNFRLAKQSSNHTSTMTPGGNSSSMMNCPLAVNAAAALAKSGPDNVDGSIAVTSPSEPLADSVEHLTAFVRPPRLPNRGHTYLRCCVFLI